MALVTVQKGSTTMTVDSSNLSIWTAAGWTQTGGSSGTGTAQPPATTTTTTPAQTGQYVTLYRGSDSMQVLPGDAAYWQGQGWSSSKPSTSGTSASGTSASSPTTVVNVYRKNEDGSYRTMPVMSSDVDHWKSQGWLDQSQVPNGVFSPVSPGQAATVPAPSGTQKEEEKPKGDTVQVINNKTKQVLTIPADQVPLMSDQWSVVGDQTKEEITASREYPKELTDLDGFDDLTPEQKAIVLFNWSAMTASSEEGKREAENALELAKQNTDPYYRSLIGYSQDELSRALTSTQADVGDQMAQMSARKKQIDQDLAFNRDQMSLEEQAEMSRLSREYDQNLRTLQTNAQEAGLVFSSPREQAESELAMAKTDVAESTNRKYARQQRELQVAAERGLEDIARDEQTTTRQAQEQATSLARKAESYLGSENLPSELGGQAIPKLGGITGDLQNQRDLELMQMQQALVQRVTPVTL